MSTSNIRYQIEELASLAQDLNSSYAEYEQMLAKESDSYDTTLISLKEKITSINIRVDYMEDKVNGLKTAQDFICERLAKLETTNEN